jgi:hypothetical protein
MWRRAWSGRHAWWKVEWGLDSLSLPSWLRPYYVSFITQPLEDVLRGFNDICLVPRGLFSRRRLIGGLRATLSASTGAIKRGPRDIVPSLPLSDPTSSGHALMKCDASL